MAPFPSHSWQPANAAVRRLPLPIGLLAALLGMPLAGADQELPITGEGMLQAARQRAVERPSVAAQIRLRMHWFDQKLVGSGTYVERQIRGEQLMRVDLQIPVAKEIAYFLRVTDGRVRWTHQDLPTAQGERRHHVTRVDRQRLREGLAQLRIERPQGPEEASGTLADHEGIAELLRQVARHYQLKTPRAGQLHELPVWRVGGIHRPVGPASQASPATVPLLPAAGEGAMPERVVVTLERESLFPFRLEFQQPDASPVLPGVSGQDKKFKTVLDIEFFEVSFDSVPAEHLFSYSPGELPVHDETDRVLSRRALE